MFMGMCTDGDTIHRLECQGSFMYDKTSSLTKTSRICTSSSNSVLLATPCTAASRRCWKTNDRTLSRLSSSACNMTFCVDNVKHRLNPGDEQSYRDEDWITYITTINGRKIYAYGPGVHADGCTVDFDD